MAEADAQEAEAGSIVEAETEMVKAVVAGVMVKAVVAAAAAPQAGSVTAASVMAGLQEIHDSRAGCRTRGRASLSQ